MAQAKTSPQTSLGGPLTLADQGSFFVGGRTLKTEGLPTTPPADFLKPGEITVD